MSQLARRLSYSIPLLLVGGLLALENMISYPYVFDKGTGPVSGAFFKVFKPESLRYSKAMVLLSSGMASLAASTPEGRRPAAADLREAAKYLTEVHRAWAIDKVPKGINGEEFDQVKRDLLSVASSVESNSYNPESPDAKRLAKYYADAKALVPNGAML